MVNKQTEHYRFWSKVTEGPGTCWYWNGCLTRKGYGQFRLTNSWKRMAAHRYAWEQIKGVLPEYESTRLQLDHLCRNRCCVNPNHLELVTTQINVLRGHGIAARNARKTHCKHGHEFTVENTSYSRGYRRCVACRKTERLKKKDS